MPAGRLAGQGAGARGSWAVQQGREDARADLQVEQFPGAGGHIISHKHMLGEKAIDVSFLFVFRDQVVGNYQHNNKT